MAFYESKSVNQGIFGIIAISLLLGSCSSREASTNRYTEVHDVKDIMIHVLEPASDFIWDSAGQIITETGTEDLAPSTDEGWEAVIHQSVVVMESANLLIIPNRVRDQADWIEISRGLVAAGQHVKDAAEAQDAEALFQAGALLYNVCVSCHQQYWVDQPIRPSDL